jgi:hypothetical protein
MGRYSHLYPEEQEKVAEALDRVRRRLQPAQVAETVSLMEEIDAAMPGWPIT